MGTGTLSQAQKLVGDAHQEVAGDRARRLLRQAAEITEHLEPINSQAQILRAEIYRELAIEETNEKMRTAFWRKSIQTISKAAKAIPDRAPELANAYGSLAVDFFQDRFVEVPNADRQQALRSSLESVDAALSLKGESFGRLLISKSSILRHIGLMEISPRAQRARFSEAKRCADLAYKQSASWAAGLEQGNCEWALSRIAETDQHAAAHLRVAENIFLSEDIQSNEIGRLTAVRFFRLSFRPLEACSIFPSETGKAESVRRVMRESYLYAEAATQLWFNNYPEQSYSVHIAEARKLLETALAGGYRNARVVTDLAFLVSIMDGARQGELILQGITLGTNIDWAAVAEIGNQEHVDLVAQGFVLGMHQSAVWTRLGTFARRFIGNDQLAEAMYRAAARLGPHDPIALTNLARHLVRRGDAASLVEAERLILRAANFADRRFFWWRHVRDELREKKGLPAQPPAKQLSKSTVITDFRQIKPEFDRIALISNAQKRGLALEKLIFDLCKITFGVASAPYKISRDVSGVVRQIDGFFYHGRDRYRIECKWLAEPADQNNMVVFANKLEVVGVSGLFISMSGYKSTAITVANEQRKKKAILLMDGDEAKAVFNGYVRFDDLMTRKRQYFDQRSEVYSRVLPSAEGI